MAIPTIQLTVSVADQGGTPVVGAIVKATLNAPDLVSGVYVEPITTSVAADANGNAILSLFPNALGSGPNGPTWYKIEAFTADQSRRIFATTAFLPNANVNLTQVYGTLPAASPPDLPMTPNVLPIIFGGTGTNSIAAFKGNLGLGTMAAQNANAVNITGGQIGLGIGDQVTAGVLESIAGLIVITGNVAPELLFSPSFGGSTTLGIVKQSGDTMFLGDSGGVKGLSLDNTTGSISVHSAGAGALSVGPNGATNPVLKIDASQASQATGVLVQGLATNLGVEIIVIGGSANEPMAIDSKGGADMFLNASAGAAVRIGSGAFASVLKMPNDGAKIIVGGTASGVLHFRDHSDASDNMTITDGGVVTSRGNLVSGGSVVTQNVTAPNGGFNLRLNATTAAAAIIFSTNSVDTWSIQNNPGTLTALFPLADNAQDLGVAGSGRLRNGFFAGTLSFGTNTAKGAETFQSFITITDAAGTSRKLMVCA